MLAANRFALGQPFAEARAQLRKRGCERVGSWSRRASHSAAHLAEKHVRERVGKTSILTSMKAGLPVASAASSAGASVSGLSAFQ